MNQLSGSSLRDKVAHNTPEGELLVRCLQCGSCGGSCPSAADMDHTPRGLFALLIAGEDNEVLHSNTPWYCVSCYRCTTRCPQNIPITDIMYTLKQMAIAKGIYDHPHAIKWSETFVGQMEQRGRSFEAGIASQYYVFHRPRHLLQHPFRMGRMGANMVRRNRLALTPKSIRELDQLTAILGKAKKLAEQEDYV